MQQYHIILLPYQLLNSTFFLSFMMNKLFYVWKYRNILWFDSKFTKVLNRFVTFQGDFNFTKCFSSGGDELRQREGEKLLKQKSASLAFDVRDMFNILRHKESRICRGCDDTFPTQGSQVWNSYYKVKLYLPNISRSNKHLYV